jgi:hypothetical protein
MSKELKENTFKYITNIECLCIYVTIKLSQTIVDRISFFTFDDLPTWPIPN